MKEKSTDNSFKNLPPNITEFINLVIKKMRYRKKVRTDVQAELTTHFEDALKDCQTDEAKQELAEELIADFGDAKMLAKLTRRAKKRCRPLWRTMVARTFQAVGIIIVFFFIYVVWFLTGKPNITTDYVAEFNRIVRPVADESLNAAPFYHKAAELSVEKPEELPKPSEKTIAELTSDERQQIQQWLNQNAEALEQIIAGNEKPYYWQQYSSETGELLDILLPHLKGFRNLSYAFCWRAQLRASQGLLDKAFDDVKACYRLGRNLKGKKTLVEQLVAFAVENLAVQTTIIILNEHQEDIQNLTDLKKSFEQLMADENFLVRFETQPLVLYDETQKCFTEDRFGGGHLCLPEVSRISSLTGSDILNSLFEKKAWQASLHILFTHPNKQETIKMIQEYYDYCQSAAHRTPAQIKMQNIDIDKEYMEIIKGNILLQILAPAFNRIIVISHLNKAEAHALLTILASLHYRADKGVYPENLQELESSGYLKELPMDPYSDEPLVYRKTENGFTLYSVGLNFKDDGGDVYREQEGRVYLWHDRQGDAVFWPVN